MNNSLEILLIEDETIIAMDLREILEESGHTVVIARDLQEALAAAKRNPPDLALVDIQLEGSPADGIAITKELLSFNPMPIIYLTSNSEYKMFQTAKATLPAAYLLKPFRPDELKLQVEMAYYNFQFKKRSQSNSIMSNFLYLPIGKGYEKIDINDVYYLMADGSYTKIFLDGKQSQYLISANLSHLEQYFLEPNFYRLSRAILINLNHIERLEQNYLYMSGSKATIQIPALNRKELMSRLKVVRTK